ncbi:MAG: NAD(P)/FAD-dependent oxidoreductase [Candidatus Thermoplasmatota archaeon]
MKNYDVIVIGGGPAGSTAAEKIADKGFSVLMIDMKKEIGKPVQCAEAITEYALENNNLPQKKRWIKQKIKGIKILLPDNHCFYSASPGLSIDRTQFDKWLAEKAIDANCKLKTHTTMKRIQGKPGRWKVVTNNGSFKSKILIGADGASSKTARILNLLTNRKYITDLQYKFNKKDSVFNENEWLCMTMNEKFQGGYGWIFTRGDEFNVGIGSLHGKLPLLNEYCKKYGFDINKKKKLNAGIVPYYFNLKSRTRKGAIIIGDAAGLTNPVTGGGIHPALYSGKKAGEITVEALEKEKIELVKKFDQKIKKTPFLNPLHRKTASYFKKWTNEDWKTFGRLVDGLEMKDLTLSRCFLMAVNHPSYFLKSRQLLNIRKEMQINKKYGW